jgi:replicative DNA helicase
MEEQYEFGHEFESSVLAVCLQDPSFLPKHYDVLNPEYFTKPESQAAVDWLMKFWNQYRSVPSINSFELFLRQQGGDAEQVLSHVRSCNRQKVQDSAFIKEQVINFARHRAVEDALLKSADLLRDGDFEEIHRLMSSGLAVGSGETKEGYNYFQETVPRFKSYMAARGDDPNVVGTGMAELDDCLDGGGLWIGELGLIQAPAGAGKTAMLVNIGYGALLQGVPVAHFTLEVSSLKAARRYDMRITGMTKQQLMTKKRTAAKQILSMAAKLSCNLNIKQFPIKTASCKDLSAYLRNRWEVDRFRPGLIIADYGEILAPERRLDDRWIEIDESYEALRALGQEWQCPVWTGSQTNKAAIGTKVSGIEHTGGSYGKIKTADVVITLNPEPRSAARAVVPLTLFGAKNREEKSGWEVLCDFNKETQTILPR